MLSPRSTFQTNRSRLKYLLKFIEKRLLQCAGCTAGVRDHYVISGRRAAAGPDLSQRWRSSFIQQHKCEPAEISREPRPASSMRVLLILNGLFMTTSTHCLFKHNLSFIIILRYKCFVCCGNALDGYLRQRRPA